MSSSLRKLYKSQRAERSVLGARVRRQLPGPECTLQDDFCLRPRDESGLHRWVSYTEGLFFPPKRCPESKKLKSLFQGIIDRPDHQSMSANEERRAPRHATATQHPAPPTS